MEKTLKAERDFTTQILETLGQGVSVVSNVEIFSHLANIGDTRSLIIHPASTTHKQLDEVQQAAAGAGPDVLRLSVGIEDAADLIADLKQALEQD